MKFTQSDTAYIKQHFISNRYYEVDSSVKNNTTYFGLLTPDQRVALTKSIRNINFTQYDSSYIDPSLKDGIMIKFFVTTDSLSKNIVIYGENAPSELLQLGKWIVEVKRDMRLVPKDTAILFFHKEIQPPFVDIKKINPHL